MILVTGGTGFVGRNIVRKLVQEEKQKVRCLVRKGGRREVLEGLDVELVEGDITSPVTLAGAMRGVDAVIHIVGIIREIPPDVTFEKIHAEGTANVVEAAKWAGEEAVRSSGIPFVIFRPSIICGKDDEFVNMFAQMVRQTWFLPVFNVIGSGKVKMQPIYVGDVAHCFVKAALSADIVNKTYELGGPERLSIDEMLDTIFRVMGVWKRKVHMPITAAWPMAFVMEKTCTKPMLTREQLIMLKSDNVGDITEMKRDFKLMPMRFEDAIRTYLQV